MAKYGILLAVLFVGGLARPQRDEFIPLLDEDMSIFFDHTVSDVEGRIVGGSNAADGAWPWIVALTVGDRTRNLLCGGSLITNRHILTAAHCIQPVSIGGVLNRNLLAVVGTNRWNSGGTSYTLLRHLNHPQYNPNIVKNDLGFLVTNFNVILGTRVRTIPIAFDFVGANIPCRVAGWGRTRHLGSISARLQELSLWTVDGNRCRTEVARVGQSLGIFVPPVDPNLEICTFLANNRGTCNGDSGGPLVRNSNNALIGIVSWGVPCARGAPDVFVRVSAFQAWIQNALR